MNEGNQGDCTYKLDGLVLPSWLCIDLLSLSREFSALVLVSDAKVTILNRNILSLVNQYVSGLIRVLKLNLQTVPQVRTWILIHQDWFASISVLTYVSLLLMKARVKKKRLDQYCFIDNAQRICTDSLHMNSLVLIRRTYDMSQVANWFTVKVRTVPLCNATMPLPSSLFKLLFEHYILFQCHLCKLPRHLAWMHFLWLGACICILD